MAQVALSMWRDEAKGLINGCRPEDQENDLASNTDDDSDNDQSAAHKKQDIDLDDRSPHHRAPLLPSSASEAASPDAWNDLNVDVAGVRDNGKQRTIGGSSSRGIDLTTDEDEAMWDELASGMDIEEMWDSPAASTTAVTSVPSNGVHVATTAGGDEDEDMWDLVRELEAEQASVVSPMHGSEAQLPAVDNLTTEGGSRPASNEAGWDDMYL
ncbi:hypothetical protein CERSUDRAFT_93983 [Gelatoporia subvermispora B]|uniref:Uncharacterized protein n=1 Tax=Ceriporiopsis subvermispora (strain B) TaxID=914234 RepID=M2PPM6_CERS8|nr:hypothetical protein CERSUDRAFT_93983 [Gelatoporia subvermispora B]